MTPTATVSDSRQTAALGPTVGALEPAWSPGHRPALSTAFLTGPSGNGTESRFQARCSNRPLSSAFSNHDERRRIQQFLCMNEDVTTALGTRNGVVKQPTSLFGIVWDIVWP